MHVLSTVIHKLFTQAVTNKTFIMCDKQEITRIGILRFATSIS